MELIIISQSKLKIMLSADDMRKYGLGSDIDYADSKTRKAFRTILDEANTQTGFDAESEKIFIQLYPSKKGGCEIYITKIDEDSDCDGYAELSVKLFEEKAQSKCVERSTGIIPSAKKRGIKERKRAYSFESAQDLLAVCRRLSSMGWKGKSSAYSDENKIFYIILCDKSAIEPPCVDSLAFILEYGKAEHYAYLSKYLDEHASCICKTKAVEQLGKL